MSHDFTMLKPIDATPDREHELGHQLFRPVVAITPRLWQSCGREFSIKSQVVEHPFHDGPATPSGDLFVAKTKVKITISSALK